MSNKTSKAATKLNGGTTDEQIQMWKNQYRRIFEISVMDGDDQFAGYFRRPDMETMSAVNKLSKTDEIKGSLVLFENCWLGGDPTMREDAIVKMKAIGMLGEVFNQCVGELKNL